MQITIKGLSAVTKKDGSLVGGIYAKGENKGQAWQMFKIEGMDGKQFVIFSTTEGFDDLRAGKTIEANVDTATETFEGKDGKTHSKEKYTIKGFKFSDGTPAQVEPKVSASEGLGATKGALTPLGEELADIRARLIRIEKHLGIMAKELEKVEKEVQVEDLPF